MLSKTTLLGDGFSPTSPDLNTTPSEKDPPTPHRKRMGEGDEEKNQSKAQPSDVSDGLEELEEEELEEGSYSNNIPPSPWVHLGLTTVITLLGTEGR